MLRLSYSFDSRVIKKYSLVRDCVVEVGKFWIQICV